MSLQPRLCLRNGEVAEEFSVRHGNLCAQRTEHIVHQVMDAVRNLDGFDLLLHGAQLLQRDCRMDSAERATELVFQDRQPVCLFRDIFRDNLQFQPVIERREDLFLRVIEIRNFVGRGEKGDRRNGIGPAFIGVFPLVERRQQCIQNTVIAFENLIQKHNVSLWNLARGLHDRFTRMQCGDRFAVGVQFTADLCQFVKRRRLIFHLRQTIQKALQINAQILVNPIALERRFRHRAGDQTGKVEPSE